MPSTKKLANRPIIVDKDGFKSLEDCITWMTYEKEVKLNPIADPILFILEQLSELINKVQQIEGDVENVRQDCTSISNELAGYDP